MGKSYRFKEDSNLTGVDVHSDTSVRSIDCRCPTLPVSFFFNLKFEKMLHIFLFDKTMNVNYLFVRAPINFMETEIGLIIRATRSLETNVKTFHYFTSFMT